MKILSSVTIFIAGREGDDVKKNYYWITIITGGAVKSAPPAYTSGNLIQINCTAIRPGVILF